MASASSTAANPGKILKQDGRGRIRTPVGEREALLDEFERSSLSGVKFAAMVGVKYATFAYWVQKRKKGRSESAVSSNREVGPSPVRNGPVRLFEAFAEVAGSGRGGGLLVELPGGGRMHLETGVHVRLAAELLRLLSTGGAARC